MENSFFPILRNIGLAKSEVQIYLAVLKLGQANVSKIAQITGLNRRNIYDSLSTLLDKGLIFQIVRAKEGIYGSVEPEKLVEMIQSKKIILNQILPDLETKYQARKIKEGAIIYQGREGFKNYLQDILNVGKEIYCLGAKGGWGDKSLGDFADWFEKERISRQIKVYNLFDYAMKDLVKKQKPLYSQFGEYRFLPEEFSTNSAINIFGDYVVTFTGLDPERFREDVTLFILVSRELADSFRTWFKFIWDFCAEK